MIKESEVLTPADKEAIKYADLILAIFKNNFPGSNPKGSDALNMIEQITHVKKMVTDRANGRREEQLQLQDNTITGEEKKQLLIKIDSGKKVDEAIAQYTTGLQIAYLQFLNINNRAQA